MTLCHINGMIERKKDRVRERESRDRARSRWAQRLPGVAHFWVNDERDNRSA